MSNRFYISDTHFFHGPSNGFFGRPYRDEQEAIDSMIWEWNDIVGENDDVWHLGDFTFDHSDNWDIVELLGYLNGRIHLILGNHDPILYNGGENYLYDFASVQYDKRFRDDLLHLTHMPGAIVRDTYHPEEWVNVHGHIHNDVIAEGPYVNVCVEQIGYKPIAHEDLMKLVEERR